MKRFLLTAVVLGMTGVLGIGSAGAFSRTAQLTSEGKYSLIITEFEASGGQYERINDLGDVYFICAAYKNIGHFNKYRTCAAYLIEEINRGGVIFPGFGNTHARRLATYLDFKVSQELGNHSQMVRLGEKYIELAALEGNSPSAYINTEIHANLAIAHASLGNTEKAHNHLNLAISPDLNGEGERQGFNLIRFIIASAFSKLSQYEGAIQNLDLFDANFLPEGLRSLFQVNVEFEYARAYMGLNDRQNAAKHLHAFLSSPQASEFGAIYWIALHMLSRINAEQGDLQGALENLMQALEKIETQRSTLLVSANKIGFVADKQKVYWDATQILIRLGDLRKAFETVERGKSRALVDLLASKSRFATRGDDRNNAALMQDLEQLSLLSVALGDNPNLDDVRARSLANNTLRQELTKKAPQLSSLVSVGEAGLADIQGRLGEDEVLLEYYGHNQDLIVFAVTGTGINAVQLNGEDLAEAVALFRADIQTVNGANFQSSSRTLHDRLIKPIAAFLKGKRLTIVPHGPLHYLPFGALHDGGRYLIERFEIRLLPSASVMRFIGDKSVAAQGLLAFGNPDLNDAKYDLPGAQKETTAIAAAWTNSKILLRKHASETSFKKFAGQFKYLHLASHGVFNTDEPLKSKMLLAPDNDNDGELTVDEVYELRLNAELVTLSACETGLGDIASGDDVIGLSRGFIYAGARSVVASLWPVADEQTAFLMERFYFNLRTMGKAKALGQAQIDTKDKYPHPVYWAAFQVTGGG